MKLGIKDYQRRDYRVKCQTCRRWMQRRPRGQTTLMRRPAPHAGHCTECPIKGGPTELTSAVMKLKMPDGREVEQGSPEDRATWWSCSRCGFHGPNVGTRADGTKGCMASCGGETQNPNVPRVG